MNKKNPTRKTDNKCGRHNNSYKVAKKSGRRTKEKKNARDIMSERGRWMRMVGEQEREA